MLYLSVFLLVVLGVLLVSHYLRMQFENLIMRNDAEIEPLNHYYCKACDIEWYDIWETVQNEYCPSCRCATTPSATQGKPRC